MSLTDKIQCILLFVLLPAMFIIGGVFLLESSQDNTAWRNDKPSLEFKINELEKRKE